MDDQTKREIQKTVREEIQRVFAQYQAVPKSIKQRHLEGVIIFTGLAANLPSGSTEVKAYFEIDTPALKIWDGSAWQTI